MNDFSADRLPYEARDRAHRKRSRNSGSDGVDRGEASGDEAANRIIAELAKIREQNSQALAPGGSPDDNHSAKRGAKGDTGHYEGNIQTSILSKLSEWCWVAFWVALLFTFVRLNSLSG